MKDWKTDKIDAEYLFESGLLFEINRSILHSVGIGIVVKKDETGKMILDFKDYRDKPEELIFTEPVYKRGHEKLEDFMVDFGHDQVKKRTKVLGWGWQSWHIPVSRRYKYE